MKKFLFIIMIFSSSLTFCKKEDTSSITGPAYAKVQSINLSLSQIENDFEFHNEDIVSKSENDIYDLSFNTSYTIQLVFYICGGSIPPAIEASSLNIAYDDNYISVERISNIDDDYLDYIEYFSLVTFQKSCESEIVFGLEDISSTMSININ